MDRAAKQLAGEMKLPGFRKGKVPPQLVIQRVGREAVLEQAIRDSLPEWYETAIIESGLPTVGDPKLDVDQLPDDGEELVFSIEIGVRPQAELGEYRGLEVGRTEVDVPEEAVDEELERLREGFGSLNPVERPAASGRHRGDRLRGHDRRRDVRGLDRARTSPSSSARRGCSRSSTPASPGSRPATTRRSRSPSPRTTSPRTSPGRPPCSR